MKFWDSRNVWLQALFSIKMEQNKSRTFGRVCNVHTSGHKMEGASLSWWDLPVTLCAIAWALVSVIFSVSAFDAVLFSISPDKREVTNVCVYAHIYVCVFLSSLEGISLQFNGGWWAEGCQMFAVCCYPRFFVYNMQNQRNHMVQTQENDQKFQILGHFGQ